MVKSISLCQTSERGRRKRKEEEREGDEITAVLHSVRTRTWRWLAVHFPLIMALAVRGRSRSSFTQLEDSELQLGIYGTCINQWVARWDGWTGSASLREGVCENRGEREGREGRSAYYHVMLMGTRSSASAVGIIGAADY